MWPCYSRNSDAHSSPPSDQGGTGWHTPRPASPEDTHSCRSAVCKYHHSDTDSDWHTARREYLEDTAAGTEVLSSRPYMCKPRTRGHTRPRSRTDTAPHTGSHRSRRRSAADTRNPASPDHTRTRQSAGHKWRCCGSHTRGRSPYPIYRPDTRVRTWVLRSRTHTRIGPVSHNGRGDRARCTVPDNDRQPRCSLDNISPLSASSYEPRYDIWWCTRWCTGYTVVEWRHTMSPCERGTARETKYARSPHMFLVLCTHWDRPISVEKREHHQPTVAKNKTRLNN